MALVIEATNVALLPKHLDPDEEAWLTREVAEHPKGADQAVLAVALVHDLHLRGGCS